MLGASGPGPWLLASGAFPSPARACAVGDAGIGPGPRHFPCPVTVGLGCAGGGFVLASADGGRTWQRAYGGSAQLEGIAAWPAGGAVAYGPDALVRTAGPRSGWRPVPLPGPGEVTWGSFPSPLDWWVALSNGCASSHGLLLECQDPVVATTDGGQAWRIIARTATYPRSAPGARVLVRQSAGGRDLGGGQGWLREANASYMTRDGGRTWTPAPEGADGSGVAMTSPRRGFRLSDLPPSGQDSTTTEVLATADGGRTWSQVGRVGEVVTGLRAGADGSLWALATQHRSVGLPGWACARTMPTCGPSVWVSADGGRVWSQHPPTVTVQAPPQWQVGLSSGATRADLGQVVTLTASSNVDVGPTPFYLEIHNLTTGTVVSSCGGGTVCSVRVSESGATTQTYVAQVAAYGGGDVWAPQIQTICSESVAMAPGTGSSGCPTTLDGQHALVLHLSNFVTQPEYISYSLVALQDVDPAGMYGDYAVGYGTTWQWVWGSDLFYGTAAYTADAYVTCASCTEGNLTISLVPSGNGFVAYCAEADVPDAEAATGEGMAVLTASPGMYDGDLVDLLLQNFYPNAYWGSWGTGELSGGVQLDGVQAGG